MTREEYIALDAINYSLLKQYLKSPKHFKAAWDNRKDDNKETEARIIGKAIHKLALEPASFKDEYAYLDADKRPELDKDFRNAKNRDWRKEQLSLMDGKSVLDKEDWSTVVSMGGSIADCDAAMRLLSGCKTEAIIQWTDAQTGIKLKAIVDFYNDQRQFPIHGDLKSLEDGSPSGVSGFISKWQTYLQLAMYGEGLQAVTGKPFDNPFIITCEKSEPYICQPYFLDQASYNLGKQVFRSLLNLHKQCLEKKEWKGYDVTVKPEDVHSGVLVAHLPDYVFNKIENSFLLQNN